MPDIARPIGELETIESSAARLRYPGKDLYAQRYELTQYKIGSYAIPSVEIRYRMPAGDWRTVSAAPAAVRIKSAFRKPPDRNFRVEVSDDMRSSASGAPMQGAGSKRSVDIPIRLRIDERLRPFGVFTIYDAAFVAALAAAAVIAVYLIVRALARLRRAEVTVSPYDIALARLSRIKDRAAPGRSDAKEVYFEISSTVREYVRAVLAADGPELSATQAISRLRESGVLTEDGIRSAAELLGTCDLVKFSGVIPAGADPAKAFKAARELVERMSAPPGKDGKG
jgi:hypothetical protein